MRTSSLYKLLALISVFFIFIWVFKELEKPKIEVSTPDQCMSCHSNYQSLDKSHPIELFGCASCHGGNKYATDKENAHVAMVKNPSRLEHASKYCGECHSDEVHRIKMNIMENQRGIKHVLHEQWVEKSTGLEDKELAKYLAQSHYAKACASCHINQDEEIFHDKTLAKGGGCADCHRVEKKKGVHPKFSTKIPSSNCLKCHNRSNRIGPSYFGKFESEGYGTPYKNGEFTNKLDSNRFYYELPADVHHSKAGLDCIDCHTEKGVMGDGRENVHMEDAVDISCKDCHSPKFKDFLPDTLAEKLIDLNDNMPSPKKIVYSQRKNAPIYNLQKDKDEKIKFYRKRDGKAFDLTKMSNKAYHTSKIHERLDCSACHTQWMASCYGCHEVYFENGKQYDWVKKEVNAGKWMEFRSFLRFESPSLGVAYNKKIMPFAPGCQVIGTVFKDKKIKQFHAMAMAGWDPHTTGKSRTCVDCHINPASLGLGRGNLRIKKDKVTFEAFYDSKKSGMSFEYPIDSFVSLEGKQFQTTSRKNARSFNKNELTKIVEAYKCILCHRNYDDKIYEDFEKSKLLFKEGKTSCLK